MRLMLDAQLSGKVIARKLREHGHDVLAIDERRDLEGIDDVTLMRIASGEGRILVTHNVRDFPQIVRDWAEEGHSHSGCVILVGVRRDEFGELIGRV
jgi:predicted nuclease of predicted toxin-antitoxin system